MRNRLRAENKALEEQKNHLNNEVQARQKKLAETEKKLQSVEDDAKSLDAEIIKKRMQYNSLADSVLEIKQDATKRVIDEMMRIRYTLQELKKHQKSKRKIGKSSNSQVVYICDYRKRHSKF